MIRWVMVLVVLWASPVQADGLLLLAGGGGATPPTGTTVLSVGTTSADQKIIPRYANGSSGAAGQIIGWGPNSILSATSATSALASASKAAIITEGFGTSYPETWQPYLRDFTLTGYSTNGWAIDGNTVNIHPETYNKTDQDSYSGIWAQAGGGHLADVTIYGIPGTAAKLSRGGGALNSPIFGKIKWNANRIMIRRVFRGLYMFATDCHATDIEVEAFRDYGVRLGKYQTTGACQFARLHTYGGGMSAADNDSLRGEIDNDEDIVPTGYATPGIWIDGDTCHGVDCYSENIEIGLLIRGSYASLDGLYSHTCPVANVMFAGAHGRVSQARIDVYADDWTIQYDTEASGPFQVNETLTFSGGTSGTVSGVTDNGTTGTLYVHQGSGPKPADNATITGGTSGATALVNGTPTTTSTSVGVEFDNQYNALNDSTLKTNGYATAIKIDNGVGQVIRNVTIDSYGNALGTGVDVNTTLYDCTIDVVISGGAKGIDFSGGSIGAGNFIRINTANGTTSAATLPANWTTTTNTTTNSQVFIDGTQYFYNPPP